MADAQVRIQYLPVTFTVPAATAQAAPVRQFVNLGTSILLDFELLIPPGHVGLTGFALELEGSRVLPFGDGTKWVVGDDQRVRFDTNLEIGRRLTLAGFNAGVYPHSWYLLLHVDLFPQPAAPGGVLLVPS